MILVNLLVQLYNSLVHKTKDAFGSQLEVFKPWHNSHGTVVQILCHHWLPKCNTLKFVLLKIWLKWFIYEFLCTWNIGKRIFFIILKFIIRSSNLVVHTCRCIWFIAWVVWIKIQNGLHCFWKEIKKGFEVKEIGNLKIKEFKKF